MLVYLCTSSRGLDLLAKLCEWVMALLCSDFCYFDFSAFSKAPLSHPKPPCGNITSHWLNFCKGSSLQVWTKVILALGFFGHVSGAVSCLMTMKKNKNHVQSVTSIHSSFTEGEQTKRVRGRKKGERRESVRLSVEQKRRMETS